MNHLPQLRANILASLAKAKVVVAILLAAVLCRNCFNNQYERRCPEQGAAAGLPFKIAKINGWSECYLKCPDSWVPANDFHGCRR